ncbi:hypothetical protein F7P69_03730 [Cellulosimicrobium funkei]|nr:hypothetical protein [Cellulosimicrobium funkei]
MSPNLSAFTPLGDLWDAVTDPLFLSPLVAVLATLAGVLITNAHHTATQKRTRAYERLAQEEGRAESHLNSLISMKANLLTVTARLKRSTKQAPDVFRDFYKSNAESLKASLATFEMQVYEPSIRERVRPLTEGLIALIEETSELDEREDRTRETEERADAIEAAAESWEAKVKDVQWSVSAHYRERLRQYLPRSMRLRSQ